MGCDTATYPIELHRDQGYGGQMLHGREAEQVQAGGSMFRVSNPLELLDDQSISQPALTADEIDAAAKRIADIIEPTPLQHSPRRSARRSRSKRCAGSVGLTAPGTPTETPGTVSRSC